MSERLWAWNGHDSYWSTSTRSFTAVLFRGVRALHTRLDLTDPARPVRLWDRVWSTTAPGMQAPDQESRYLVAIAGPSWPGRGVAGEAERYVLRGSLRTVRAKLLAALERRQNAYDQRPPSPAVDRLDWRADGPWDAPFHQAPLREETDG